MTREEQSWSEIHANLASWRARKPRKSPDHAALCRKLLAALIETRHVAAFALGRLFADGTPVPERFVGFGVRADAAIREAQEALK